MAVAEYVAGNTHRFIATVQKDGTLALWDQVYLVLTNPAGVAVAHACTFDGTDWYFDTANDELSGPGTWARRWRGTAGALDNEDFDRNFDVAERRGT